MKTNGAVWKDLHQHHLYFIRPLFFLDSLRIHNAFSQNTIPEGRFLESYYVIYDVLIGNTAETEIKCQVS